MDIKGSVALVTGGGNGIGEAVVKHLARQGAKVAVVDMAQKNIDRVVKDIQEMGGEAIGIQANVTSEADTARYIKGTIEAFGQLNIAVSCAGIIRDGTMLSLDKETGQVSKKLDLAKWQAVIDTNLTGTFLCMRDAAEAMVNGGWEGLLVPISSVNKVGQVGQLNYSSAKVADALMPKIIVGEFLMRGIRNIRCVAVAPGYTATPPKPAPTSPIPSCAACCPAMPAGTSSAAPRPTATATSPLMSPHAAAATFTPPTPFSTT